jgi:hypothetical protein
MDAASDLPAGTSGILVSRIWAGICGRWPPRIRRGQWASLVLGAPGRLPSFTDSFAIRPMAAIPAQFRHIVPQELRMLRAGLQASAVSCFPRSN